MPVAPAWSDTTFASMGSTARILVLGGPPDLPERARARLRRLEARWSRFLPASELCRLNAAAGAPVVVSPETFGVIALAIAAWHATGGRFDPTVLDALERAGYDRDFEALTATGAGAGMRDTGSAGPAPGCGAIELDRLVAAVRLPRGVHLDLGGIGKGHAADLVANELLASGADGVCVNLGGDVRVAGVAPDAAGWRIELDPALTPTSASPRAFCLRSGAVATSTRNRRTWTRGDEQHHHLIDPRTGHAAWSGLAAVTVLAESAAWAEILAKSAFVAGPVAGAELIDAHGVAGLFIHDGGRVEELPGVAAYVA